MLKIHSGDLCISFHLYAQFPVIVRVQHAHKNPEYAYVRTDEQPENKRSFSLYYRPQKLWKSKLH